MHWVPHAIACVQRTYVACASKGIQWCWGTYLRGEIKRLEVEWTGTLVDCRHSDDDLDCFISDGCRLELWLSLYWAVQTRHILQTNQATRRNGQIIWILETSTWRLHQILLIVHPSWLPSFRFLRKITSKNTETYVLWSSSKSTTERFWGTSLTWLFFLSTPISTLVSIWCT